MKQQNHPCDIDAKNVFGGLTCQMSVYFKHIWLSEEGSLENI